MSDSPIAQSPTGPSFPPSPPTIPTPWVLPQYTTAAEATPPTPRRRPRFGSTAQWTRWLHVYTSMISLLVVLFFGLTGLTLNHPSWTFGAGPTTTVESGTIPPGFVDNGVIDFLAVTEYVRATNGVSAPVSDYDATGTEGTVAFAGPGYAASLIFDAITGDYQLTVEQQGIVGILNDLHKGRDTAAGWNWAIDASALLLVVVAVTGLGIQIFQKKRRRRALMIAGAASVVSLIWIVVTMS